MKRKLIILSVSLILIFIDGCRKYDDFSSIPPIEFGVTSKTTTISSISEPQANIFNVKYNLTVGSKYSVQIIPFQSETPVKTIGFTAEASTLVAQYNLNDVAAGSYDLVLTDISGNVIKRPILVN